MDEIIDYVMETPSNTNPNVLRGMLNNNGGSSSGVLIVTEKNNILDHTWQEIHDAAPLVWLKQFQRMNAYLPFAGDGVEEGVYLVAFDGVAGGSPQFYMTNSADGHPEADK